MITFVKNWVAIPTIIILLLVFAGIIRDDRKEKQNVEQVVSVNLLMIVLCAACLIVIGFLAGWGGYFPQRGDWLKHNAVMHDLVERSWPVYYYNGEVKSYLSYYIGGYLVPAAIGKLFRSFEVAEFAQLIYNNITLFLVWLNIVCYLRIRKIRYGFCTVGMMTFFSGGLMLAQATVRILYPDLLMLGNTHWFSGPSFALQYRVF